MSYTLISDLFSEQDNYMPRNNNNMHNRFENGTSQYRTKVYQEDFPQEQVNLYKKSILPNTKISNHFVPRMMDDHTDNYQLVLKQIFDKLSSMSMKDSTTCNCTSELSDLKKKVDSSDIMLKGIILVLFILLIVVLLKK
jgi:hypothetical protein